MTEISVLDPLPEDLARVLSKLLMCKGDAQILEQLCTQNNRDRPQLPIETARKSPMAYSNSLGAVSLEHPSSEPIPFLSQHHNTRGNFRYTKEELLQIFDSMPKEKLMRPEGMMDIEALNKQPRFQLESHAPYPSRRVKHQHREEYRSHRGLPLREGSRNESIKEQPNVEPSPPKHGIIYDVIQFFSRMLVSTPPSTVKPS